MKDKVLIALNDNNLANAIAIRLQTLNYDVIIVKDGTSVISKIKLFIPDLILIDVVLPGQNGYEVLSEKSFDRDITKIPVIIVSNSGEPLKMKSIPSTPTIKDYVVKSHIEPSEVVEKIEKIFNRNNDIKMDTQTKTGKKVLWVEDDKLLSTILSNKIQSSGFTLLKANNDKDAFKYLETEVPDVIVLDIMLPEMSGFDILQKIKTMPNLKNIPSIMLSNLSKQSDIERAKMLGANKFIVKAAVSLDEIIKEVGTLAGR